MRTLQNFDMRKLLQTVFRVPGSAAESIVSGAKAAAASAEHLLKSPLYSGCVVNVLGN